MCLIVRQAPTTPHLTDDEVKAIYKKNSDGFGAAWYDPDAGRVTYFRRVPSTAADAVSLYRHAMARDAASIVCHWRMATGGTTSDDMAHPFPIASAGAVLIHNGVMSTWQGRADKGQSDTAALAAWLDATARCLARPADLWSSDLFRAWARREFVGQRIVVVGADGQIHHYGDDGIDHADRWISNSYAGPASILPPPRVTTSTYVPPGGWGRGWSAWGRYDDETPPRGTARPYTAPDLSEVDRARPTSDKPTPVKPAPTTRKARKARKARGAYLPDTVPDLTRCGVIAYGSIRDVAAWAAAHPVLEAIAPAGTGWLLLDDDPDVARYGLASLADAMQGHAPPDRYVRVVDLSGDRVSLRVDDVPPRCET